MILLAKWLPNQNLCHWDAMIIMFSQKPEPLGIALCNLSLHGIQLLSAWWWSVVEKNSLLMMRKNGFHLKNESDIDDDEWFPHIGILKPVHFQSDQEFYYNRWWESFIDFQTFTFWSDRQDLLTFLPIVRCFGSGSLAPPWEYFHNIKSCS